MPGRAITLAELKRHLVDPPLADAELQLLLDAAADAVAERIGPVGIISETRQGSGRLLLLSRRAEAVVSVSMGGRAVSSSAYRLRPSGEVIERTDGSVFRGSVDVVMQVVPDWANRNRAVVGLVKLDLAYTPGISSETLGSYTESSSQQQGVTYAQLREEYLASLVVNPFAGR